jgi:hypothetical protein
MKLIQLLLLFVMIITVIAVRGKRSYYSRLFPRLGLIVLVSAFSIAILFPALLQRLANFLDVGRGADLIIYLNSISIFCFALVVFVKVKEIEEKIVILTRELTLMSQKDPD